MIHLDIPPAASKEWLLTREAVPGRHSVVEAEILDMIRKFEAPGLDEFTVRFTSQTVLES